MRKSLTEDLAQSNGRRKRVEKCQDSGDDAFHAKGVRQIGCIVSITVSYVIGEAME